MTLLWKTELDRSISVIKCITAMRAYYKEGGCYRRQTCRLDVEKAVLLWGCIFWIGRLGI